MMVLVALIHLILCKDSEDDWTRAAVHKSVCESLKARNENQTKKKRRRMYFGELFHLPLFINFLITDLSKIQMLMDPYLPQSLAIVGKLNNVISWWPCKGMYHWTAWYVVLISWIIPNKELSWYLHGVKQLNPNQ